MSDLATETLPDSLPERLTGAVGNLRKR
jgi:hypothetical protein